MANLLDLMRYASRGAIARSDLDTRDEPPDTSDEGHRFIQQQLQQRPEPYHDPVNDELVEVPGVSKLLANKKKGTKVLKKMADKSETLGEDDPLPQHGTDTYYDLIEDLMRSQRGPKEKL